MEENVIYSLFSMKCYSTPFDQKIRAVYYLFRNIASLKFLDEATASPKNYS